MELRSEAEEKAAAGCYDAVAPHAAVLAALAQPGEKVDAEKVRAAVVALAESKNAFVQIVLGRLMGGPLAARVDPSGYTGVIAGALASPHAECVRGACAWAGLSKDASLDGPLRRLLEHKDASVRAAAKAALERRSSGKQ